MKKTANTHQIEALANFSWLLLQKLLQQGKKRRPPVYLYLSDTSKGSLRQRSVAEKNLVHHQQFRAEAITLRSPPAAWVAQLDQVPEETAHLFALCYQRRPAPSVASLQEEWQVMCLHEAFGAWAQAMITGLPTRLHRAPKTLLTLTEKNLWPYAHRIGYFLGQQLAKKTYEESLKLNQICQWFKLDWHGPQGSQKALKRLYKLTRA